MPPLPVPAPWDGLPVTPARVRWRVRRGGRTVRPWHTPIDFSRQLLPKDEFRRIYAPGTRQNRSGRPGLYRFYLAHTWSTTCSTTAPIGSRSKPPTCAATRAASASSSRSPTTCNSQPGRSLPSYGGGASEVERRDHGSVVGAGLALFRRVASVVTPEVGRGTRSGTRARSPSPASRLPIFGAGSRKTMHNVPRCEPLGGSAVAGLTGRRAPNLLGVETTFGPVVTEAGVNRQTRVSLGIPELLCALALSSNGPRRGGLVLCPIAPRQCDDSGRGRRAAATIGAVRREGGRSRPPHDRAEGFHQPAAARRRMTEVSDRRRSSRSGCDATRDETLIGYIRRVCLCPASARVRSAALDHSCAPATLRFAPARSIATQSAAYDSGIAGARTRRSMHRAARRARPAGPVEHRRFVAPLEGRALHSRRVRVSRDIVGARPLRVGGSPSIGGLPSGRDDPLKR